MNETKPEGIIGIGDVVRIFSGYRHREMVDIMTSHTGEHLTEMVYVLRYLNR